MVSHGSPQKKLRTISCSSASETEADPTENQTQDDILMKRPPPVHRVAVLNEVARSVEIFFDLLNSYSKRFSSSNNFVKRNEKMKCFKTVHQCSIVSRDYFSNL